MANWYISDDGYVVNGYPFMSPMTEDRFTRLFHKCEFCDNMHIQDALFTDIRSGKKCCNECYRARGNTKCQHCGSPIHRDDAITIDGYVICSECLKIPSIKFCSKCGKPHFVQNMEFFGEEEGYGCVNCFGEAFGCNQIRGYHSFKNNRKFKFNDLGEKDKIVHPYMGFELEVDDGHNTQNTLQESNKILRTYGEYGFLHYENDGSLSEDGFEMISQPSTLGWYIEHRDMLRDLFTSLTSGGWRSHDTDTCGLHVHIDRKFFEGDDEEASYRMAYLFNRFWGYFVKFSRRSEYAIEEWCDDYSLETIDDLRDRSLDVEDVGRYHAVNITNRDTIEIRIARGTLNLHTFFATLKLYDRIANIVKKSSYDEIDLLNWEDVLGDDEEINTYWERRNS